MASNFKIPGLGQIQPNETLPYSTFGPDVLAAAASIGLDVEMPDANGPSKVDNEPNKQVQQSEEEQKMQQESLVQQSTGFAENKEEPKDQEEMKDEGAHQTTGDDAPSAAIGSEVSATIPKQEENIVQQADQTTSAVQETPGDVTDLPRSASPGVTDALEAALDGLLGPPPANEATVVEKQVEEPKEQANGGNGEGLVVDEQMREQDGEVENIEVDANPEWEVDSSPYESSSSDSSDSSDDDSDEDESNLLGIEETARLLMEADGGSDDEADGAKAAKQAASVRTKNEKPDEPEVLPDVTITPEDTIIPLGLVQHIVEGTQVVIEALRDNGSSGTILDRGSVLCKEDRTVIGVIHDTIATVHKPMYLLSFRGEEGVKEAGIEKGVQIWYPKKHATFVFPSQLRQEKGSDASNLHDEEVGPEEMEYSDDEMEQAHKREKKNRKRGGKGKFGKDRADDRAPHSGPDPARNADPGLNYDEDEDGPYKKLTRPANFGLGLPPPPPPGVSGLPSANGSRGGPMRGRGGDFRGRGRGGDRGRGGRGRGFGGRGRGSNLNPGQGQVHHSLPPQPPPHLPPPPYGANTLPPPPSQWPFPIPPMPQFGGAVPPPPQMPSWSPNQASPFPFPPVPPPNWTNQAPRPPPPSSGYLPNPTAGGHGMGHQYLPSNAQQQQQHQPPAPTGNYPYQTYYGAQPQNGSNNNNNQHHHHQQQHWG